MKKLMRYLASACLAGGALILSNAAFAKPWKGAEMITKETYKYGAFEARIRGAKGSGMITAFFMWKHGSEIPGAQWQEQDFELFGKNGTYQTQVMTPGNPRTEHKVYHTLPAPVYDKYYTYRMEWTPNHLAFYVDGRLVRRETNKVEYAKLLDPARAEPAQMRLSMWAGDWGWSGAFDPTMVPAAVFVEYAQVFNYTPGAGPGGSDFSLRWRDDFEFINNNRWWFANWTFEYAVNDYTPRNATTIDGKLALILTSWQNEGRFPTSAPADNPVVPPLPEPEPEPEVPYEPTNIPGRVEAEIVNDYFDTSPGNIHHASCSTTDLDAERTSDTGGGCNVSETRPSEWTEYVINVPETGSYKAVLRAATARSNNVMHMEIDGVNVTGPITVPQKGWQSFVDLPVDLQLAKGMRTVRIYFDSGMTNLNYIDFFKVATTPEEPEEPETPEEPEQPTNMYVPVAVPGRVEAEIVNAFYDTSPGNKHDPTCSKTDMDAERTLDAGGGCNVSETRPGEWTEYKISVTEGRTYNAILRLATDRTGIAVRLEINGANVGGPIAVPRLGWQYFQDAIVPVTLTPGIHTVRVHYDTGMANLNYIDFQ